MSLHVAKTEKSALPLSQTVVKVNVTLRHDLTIYCIGLGRRQQTRLCGIYYHTTNHVGSNIKQDFLFHSPHMSGEDLEV